MKRESIAAIAVASVLVLGAVLEKAPVFSSARETLRARSVSSDALRPRSNTLLRILRRLELLHPQLDDSADRGDPGPRRLPPGYSLASHAEQALACVSAVEPEQAASGRRILSLTLGPEDLQDLYDHPSGRGREWERFGCVAYFEAGKLVFATGVGGRLHGGRSRELSEVKSFRLYFRDLYGADHVAQEVLFDHPGPDLTELVVHNDVRRDSGLREWHLVNPLAYDISRRIGALAPLTQPALFYLNGQKQGLYVLTERLGPDYVRAHFGREDFLFFRTKKDEGGRGLVVGDWGEYEELRQWLSATSPLTMESAAGRIDLESLSRWFVSVLFCGTTDALQGALLWDQSSQRSGVFWINWDMDHSFMNARPSTVPPWEVDIFEHLRGRKDLRAMALRRLLRDSPEYRAYFADLFQEAMNHRVTDEFLDRRLAYYHRVGRTYEVANAVFGRTVPLFFEHREAVLRQQMMAWAGVGESFGVEVSAGGCDVRVDGHAVGASYSGSYFAGSSLEVEVIGPCRRRFSHWRINGSDLLGQTVHLRRRVDGPWSVELVLVESDAEGGLG